MIIYTYATHSEGFFDELIKGEYAESIRVIGFGSKWNGYMDRVLQLRNAIVSDNVSDDEIIVCIDGFDSHIRLNPQIALERYEQNFPNHPVLVSMNIGLSFISNFVFLGNLNAGMYMGPAKKVCNMMSEMLKTGEKDDQRALNIVNNKNYSNIIMDERKMIFHNLEFNERGSGCTSHKSKAVFLSCPGQLTFPRFVRGLFDYSFYYVVIIVILISMTCVIIMLKRYSASKTLCSTRSA